MGAGVGAGVGSAVGTNRTAGGMPPPGTSAVDADAGTSIVGAGVCVGAGVFNEYDTPLVGAGVADWSDGGYVGAGVCMVCGTNSLSTNTSSGGVPPIGGVGADVGADVGGASRVTSPQNTNHSLLLPGHSEDGGKAQYSQ